MNSRIRTPFYIFFSNPVYVAARSLRSNYLHIVIMPTLQHHATLSSRHVLKRKPWIHGTLEHRNTWTPRNTKHNSVWKSSIKNSVDCSIYLSGHRWLGLTSLHQLTTILEWACKQASLAGHGVQSLSTLLMRDICETGIYVTFRLIALWSLDNFCFRWYATLENKTPAETFPKFPLVLRVIDISDGNHSY